MDKQKIVSDAYDELLAEKGNWKNDNFEIVLIVGGLRIVSKTGEKIELKFN